MNSNLENLVLTTEVFLQNIKRELNEAQPEGRYLRIADSKNHAKYPVPNKPKNIFLFSKDKGVVVDCDVYVNPYTAHCDAYVLTDKGIHLIYIKGSSTYHNASYYHQFYSDPKYTLLNKDESEYPMFFVSKVTKNRRVCTPISKHGEIFAAEYNFLVHTFLDLPF